MNGGRQGPIDRRTFLLGAAAVGAGCSVSVDIDAAPTPEPEPTATSDGLPLFGPQPVGAVDELQANLAEQPFLYVPASEAWLVAYPAELVDDAKAVYPEELHPGLDSGFLALYQKCPHMGCRVPECVSSNQFECPCHASKYSQFGEYRSGPAPRGMDLFAIVVDGDQLAIDRSAVIEGLPASVDISGTTAEGANCIT